MLKKLIKKKLFWLLSCITILALIVGFFLYQKQKMQELVKKIEANGTVQYKSYPFVEKLPNWLQPTVERFAGKQIYNVLIQENIDC